MATSAVGSLLCMAQRYTKSFLFLRSCSMAKGGERSTSVADEAVQDAALQGGRHLGQRICINATGRVKDDTRR